jgi:hypothetical protein
MLVLFCIPCDSGGQASSNLVLSESDRRPHAPHTQRQLTIVQRAMSTLTTSSISDPIWTEHEGNKRSSQPRTTGRHRKPNCKCRTFRRAFLAVLER